jgi:hypothetical protein
MSIPSISAYICAGDITCDAASAAHHVDAAANVPATSRFRHNQKPPSSQISTLRLRRSQHKTVTRIRLVPQLMLDHARKRIDPAPHIPSIPRHIDTFHRRDAEHYRPRHRRTTPNSEAARSAGTPAVKTHLTPLRVENVTRRRRRRRRRAGDCTTSSMKPGIPPSWRRQRPGDWGTRTDTVQLV